MATKHHRGPAAVANVGLSALPVVRKRSKPESRLPLCCASDSYSLVSTWCLPDFFYLFFSQAWPHIHVGGLAHCATHWQWWRDGKIEKKRDESRDKHQRSFGLIAGVHEEDEWVRGGWRGDEKKKGREDDRGKKRRAVTLPRVEHRPLFFANQDQPRRDEKKGIVN